MITMEDWSVEVITAMPFGLEKTGQENLRVQVEGPEEGGWMVTRLRRFRVTEVITLEEQMGEKLDGEDDGRMPESMPIRLMEVKDTGVIVLE